MSRQCLFCGDTELSNEHIIAQWLLKELGILRKPLAMVHFSTSGATLSDRSHSFSKLVNGLVCKKCNSGWMSKLELENMQIVKDLIIVKNPKKALDKLASNPFSFAKWAFKNAILLNYAVNYRKLVAESHFKDLYNNVIPQNVWISIGITSNEDVINWRQSQTLIAIKHSGGKPDIPSMQNNYKITFQFGELMVKTLFYHSDNEVYFEDTGAISVHPKYGIHGEFDVFKNIDSFDLKGIVHEY